MSVNNHPLPSPLPTFNNFSTSTLSSSTFLSIQLSVATSPLASPRLLSPSSSSSSPSSSHWQCPYLCGVRYCRSSGRSIRRHVVSCFRLHHPDAVEWSDERLSAAIAEEQDSGQLKTGLRRWRLRRPRRHASDLSDADRWDCVWGCDKSCRATSTRSIQRHANRCSRRADGRTDDVDVKWLMSLSRQQRHTDRMRMTLHDYNEDEEGDASSERFSSPDTAFAHLAPASALASVSATISCSAVHDSSDVYSPHFYSPQSSSITGAGADWTLLQLISLGQPAPAPAPASASAPAAGSDESGRSIGTGASQECRNAIVDGQQWQSNELAFRLWLDNWLRRQPDLQPSPQQPLTQPQPPHLLSSTALVPSHFLSSAPRPPPSSSSLSFPPLVTSASACRSRSSDPLRAYTDMLSRYLLSA